MCRVGGLFLYMARTASALLGMILAAFLPCGLADAQPVAVKTNFFQGPALTSKEISEVIELAKKCGLSQPVLISDQRVLPPSSQVPRALVVEGAENVQARKVSREWLIVGCTNWSPATPELGPLRVGSFYVNRPYLRTTESIVFQVGNKSIKIALARTIPLKIADDFVEKLAAGRMHFGPQASDPLWNTDRIFELTGLSQDPVSGDYVFYFGSPTHTVFRFKQLLGGDLLITASSHPIW